MAEAGGASCTASGPSAASVATSSSASTAVSTLPAAAGSAPALRIPAGQTVTLDTYFNTFVAFKWVAYTTATDLAVEVTLRGAATVELVGVSRADLAREEVLCTCACASDGSAAVRILACDDLAQLRLVA